MVALGDGTGPYVWLWLPLEVEVVYVVSYVCGMRWWDGEDLGVLGGSGVALGGTRMMKRDDDDDDGGWELEFNLDLDLGSLGVEYE